MIKHIKQMKFSNNRDRSMPSTILFEIGGSILFPYVALMLPLCTLFTGMFTASNRLSHVNVFYGNFM